MPEKTDAEWQALDARIAWVVMGWVKWDELSIVNQQLIAIYNRRTWLTLDELDCPHSTDLLYRNWKPHNNISQAMLARDRIASQGFDWCISRWAGAPEIQVLFMQGTKHYDGYAKTDGQAICLAIEQWMDTHC